MNYKVTYTKVNGTVVVKRFPSYEFARRLYFALMRNTNIKSAELNTPYI